ncbi:MAG: hypothetical protein LBT22_02760 [Peptococcaceae bacterium]|nr:hypothetical protein [Peptococcaceae bacterium]
MSIAWQELWKSHANLFLGEAWTRCPPEKVRALRLSAKYAYFMGGDISLRLGIIASAAPPREDDFLMNGILWANGLSNGAKTVLYFVAPDFSPFFLLAIHKIGGNLTAKGIYWREKLDPSLYLVSERRSDQVYSLGEKRPHWRQWSLGLDSVAIQQLKNILDFFQQYQNRGIRTRFKQRTIQFYWGNLEIAEIIRRGKKLELTGKGKWDKDQERGQRWKKTGWVDASGQLNQEFQRTMNEMLAVLEGPEFTEHLPPSDKLKLFMMKNEERTRALWGEPWIWPWLPKNRQEFWIADLEDVYYFQHHGNLRVVYPILGRPLPQSSYSLLLTSVLEHSALLKNMGNEAGEALEWNGLVYWLTTPSKKAELSRWQCWLKNPHQFRICTLTDDWESGGAQEFLERKNLEQPVR